MPDTIFQGLNSDQFTLRAHPSLKRERTRRDKNVLLQEDDYLDEKKTRNHLHKGYCHHHQKVLNFFFEEKLNCHSKMIINKEHK